MLFFKKYFRFLPSGDGTLGAHFLHGQCGRCMGLVDGLFQIKPLIQRHNQLSIKYIPGCRGIHGPDTKTGHEDLLSCRLI